MLIVLLGLLSVSWVPVAMADEHEGQKIVVHLSHFSDDLHAASMALSLATNLREGGATVTLFLDLEGARLADARAFEKLQWGAGPTMGDRFAKFVKSGGSVLVCPHCAEAAGLDSGNLRKGVRIAEHVEVRQIFIEATKVIDY